MDIDEQRTFQNETVSKIQNCKLNLYNMFHLWRAMQRLWALQTPASAFRPVFVIGSYAGLTNDFLVAR